MWYAVDKDGTEGKYSSRPLVQFLGRGRYESDYLIRILDKGSIEKLIGKKLTWEDEPVEIAKLSNCCNEPIIEETTLCSKCKEHCK